MSGNPQELATRYMAALEAADVEAILALFHPDAKVVSPLYGTHPAQEFFTRLLRDTAQSTLRLHAVLSGLTPDGGTSLVALYFRYRWRFRDGRDVEFDIVDLFELDDDGRILSLTIVEDTAVAKPAFEASTGRPAAREQR